MTCSREAQRARLLGRGMDHAEADRRIAAQGDLATRLAPAATRVIDASAEPEATRRRVGQAFAAAIAAD